MVSLLLCEVFKSARKEQMYLYVDKARGVQDVPESLMAMFGEPESVMLLPLTPERKLARVSAEEVLDAIASQGYFLQMPPPPGVLAADAFPGEESR